MSVAAVVVGDEHGVAVDGKDGCGCSSSGRGVRVIRAARARGLFPSDILIVDETTGWKIMTGEPTVVQPSRFPPSTLYTSSLAPFLFLFFLRVVVLASASCSSFGSAARTALMGR